MLGIPEEDGVDAAAWFDETTHVQVSSNANDNRFCVRPKNGQIVLSILLK